MNDHYSASSEGSARPWAMSITGARWVRWTPQAAGESFDSIVAVAAERARETGGNQVIRHHDGQMAPLVVTLQGRTGELCWPRLAVPQTSQAALDRWAVGQEADELTARERLAAEQELEA